MHLDPLSLNDTECKEEVKKRPRDALLFLSFSFLAMVFATVTRKRKGRSNESTGTLSSKWQPLICSLLLRKMR